MEPTILSILIMAALIPVAATFAFWLMAISASANRMTGTYRDTLVVSRPAKPRRSHSRRQRVECYNWMLNRN